MNKMTQTGTEVYTFTHHREPVTPQVNTASVLINDKSWRALGCVESKDLNQEAAQQYIDADSGMSFDKKFGGEDVTPASLRRDGYQAMEVQYAGGPEEGAMPGLFKIHPRKTVTVTL